jgi:hypothetical protein
VFGHAQKKISWFGIQRSVTHNKILFLTTGEVLRIMRSNFGELIYVLYRDGSLESWNYDLI